MQARFSWRNIPSSNWEKFVFLGFVLLNCIPVLTTKYVVTMDGAAHLANATYLNELLFGTNTTFSSYLSLNPVIVPNWLGHGILLCCKWFVPGFMAEKALILVYLIGLPYAFRYFLKQLNPESTFIAYWILPFAYNALFLLGFYNFSLGMVLFFWTLGYWQNKLQTGKTRKHYIVLGLLLLSTYFAHVFVVCLLLALVFLLTLINRFKVDSETKAPLHNVNRELGRIALVALPSLLLLLLYFKQQLSSSKTVFLKSSELFNWLRNLQPLIFDDFNSEIAPVKILLYTLIGLGIFLILQKLYASKKGAINWSDTWIILALLLLGALFVLPDEAQGAGFVSLRLAYLFFLIYLVWIGSQLKRHLLVLLTLIPLSLVQGIRLFQMQHVFQERNELALELDKATKKLKPHTVVLPLVLNANYKVGHISNYLAADNPVLLLENYEAAQTYFPLKWNLNQLPNFCLDTLQSASIPGYEWTSVMENPKRAPDYIVVIHGSNKQPEYPRELKSYFNMKTEKLHVDSHVEIYQVK